MTKVNIYPIPQEVNRLRPTEEDKKLYPKWLQRAQHWNRSKYLPAEEDKKHAKANAKHSYGDKY